MIYWSSSDFSGFPRNLSAVNDPVPNQTILGFLEAGWVLAKYCRGSSKPGSVSGFALTSRSSQREHEKINFSRALREVSVTGTFRQKTTHLGAAKMAKCGAVLSFGWLRCVCVGTRFVISSQGRRHSAGPEKREYLGAAGFLSDNFFNFPRNSMADKPGGI